MAQNKLQFILDEQARLEKEGLLVKIRTIESPQGAWITVDGKKVLNLCSNNYLGFANDSRLKQAARKAIDEFGVGPAAVRSIAGTTKRSSKVGSEVSRQIASTSAGLVLPSASALSTSSAGISLTFFARM